MQIAGGWEISRRYAVMNGFDGILTVFAVVLSSFLLGVEDPRFILATGFSASVAIGISGFWIAYLTEEAEQSRHQKELEEKIFTDLDNTMIAEAGRVAAIVNSVIDGASPFIFGTLVISPFIFVGPFDLEMNTVYIVSMVVSAILLFVLGVFLGRVSRSTGWIMGIKTLFAGIVVGLLTILIE